MHSLIEFLALALGLPLFVLQAWLFVVTAYITVLAVASFFYRRRASAESWERKRIAILVPAHNESDVIGRLLASLNNLEYPRDAFEVFVVADNCTDDTAEIARDLGATVHERFNSTERGKGYALRWLIERLPIDKFDAVFVIDADSVASTNILSVANAALLAGHELGQVYDGVLNRDTSPAAAMRALAFDLHNYVRPLGNEALGASCGLMGNGMLIATSCLEEDAWNAFGLAEDLEVHAKLLGSGRRVHFLPEASVLAEMPDTFAASEGQNLRWEAGRLDVARRHGLPLLRQGLRQRSWVQVAAALETFVPPQSAQVVLTAAGLAAAIVIQPPHGLLLGVATVAGQAIYLGLGMIHLSRRGVSLRQLRHAPVYILWKSLLYAKALTGNGSREWVKGGRNEQAPGRQQPERQIPERQVASLYRHAEPVEASSVDRTSTANVSSTR